MRHTTTTIVLLGLLAAACVNQDEPFVDPRPPQCATSADCAGAIEITSPCMIPICVAGASTCAAVAVADGTACDDGDACSVQDACTVGVCRPGAPLVCDDGNLCTDDACDPSAGCTHVPNTAACDDGLACTSGDVCAGGTCAGAGDCSCTGDADCADDGNLCNGQVFCDQAAASPTCAVVPDSKITCDTGADACATAACNPASGLCEPTPRPDGTTCDDADPCTKDDVCTAGACGGAVNDCDDKNPCTVAVCHPKLGCLVEPNGECGECAGLQCLPCAYGSQCATEGAKIGDTCCAEGDSLVYLGQGQAAEAVDIEVDDTHAYLCGGFGVRMNRITNPAQPKFESGALSRCQRIAVGPKLANGDQVVWFAHQGDTWVENPFLATYHVVGDLLVQKDIITEASTLFEGMTYHAGFLFSAVHASGLRVYSVDGAGKPQLATELSGLTNAWKVAGTEGALYVADGEGGLKVVDIADPLAPVIAQSLKTDGVARDVAVHQGRVFVALGGNGVAVFDAANPLALEPVATIEAGGSVQAVSADNGLLGVAAWSHLAVYDAATLKLLGTEDVKLWPEFEQVFGVAMRDDIAYVAEWEGLHTVQYVPGYVAPDLWIKDELVDFGLGDVNQRGVLVRNRGLTTLEVTSIEVSDPDLFSVSPASLTVAPGGVDLLEITFNAPAQTAFNIKATLTMATNDPDPGQNPFKLHLVGNASETQLNVGDTLGPEFGFLDPTGGGQLDNLKGNVIVLAYFALF